MKYIHIRFMTWLYDHLEEGSFRTAYADTDSMCLALSKSAPDPGPDATKEEQLRAFFDPLVKPSMKSSWESSWKDWFVTTSTVEDRRKPGKLKGEIVHLKCKFFRIHQLIQITTT